MTKTTTEGEKEAEKRYALQGNMRRRPWTEREDEDERCERGKWGEAEKKEKEVGNQ